MSSEFMISIRLMTYNHEAYIREAMDGIMMQKANFNIEVVVGDDFSTDGTLQIIKEFDDTQNIKIKILDRKVNGSYWNERQKVGRLYNFSNILENCSGKYIALLDGDDYWTDPYKLQKQVNFLEANKDFIFCGHDVRVKDESLNSFAQSCIYQKNIIELKDTIFGPPVHTSSWVFLNGLKLPKHFVKLIAGDDAMMCYLASKGKCHSLNEIMGVYRLSSAGTWSVLSQVEKDYRTLIIQLWTIKNYPIRLKDQTKQIYILVKNIKDYKSILSDNFSFQQKALAMLSVFAHKIFNSPEEITSFSNRIKGGLKRRIKSLKKTNYLP